MNEMMAEVLRRQERIRLRRYSDRWTAWGRSLAGRFVWVSSRHRAPAMELLQPWVPLYVFCQRWEHLAWTLRPQINLAISPILHQVVWRKTPILPAGQAPTLSFKQPSHRSERAMTYGVDEAMPFIGHRSKQASIEIPGAKAVLLGEPLNSGSQTPLIRVFRRMSSEDVNGTVTVSRLDRRRLIPHESLRLVRRVVEERQRVEYRTQRILVGRDRRTLMSAATRADAAPLVTQSPRGIRVGTPGMNQMASLQPIDIESLTEHVVRQIDRRIVAYRERMGTLFRG